MPDSARGETAYLAGISIGGFHNSGVALIEVRPEDGLRIICNNEEERFSGRKHANNYPSASLRALIDTMRSLGISPERIVAWLGTYDYPLLVATGIRSVLEEFPASMHLMFQDPSPTFDRKQFKQGICAPVRLGQLFGRAGAVPIIGMAHHDNHAWFSYLVSPFARDARPVIIVVIDGSGDFASTKSIQDAFGIKSDDVANCCFPKTWPPNREQRGRIIGRLRRAFWPDLISSAM